MLYVLCHCLVFIKNFLLNVWMETQQDIKGCKTQPLFLAGAKPFRFDWGQQTIKMYQLHCIVYYRKLHEHGYPDWENWGNIIYIGCILVWYQYTWLTSILKNILKCFFWLNLNNDMNHFCLQRFSSVVARWCYVDDPKYQCFLEKDILKKKNDFF